MNLSVEHVLLFALVVCAFYYSNQVEGILSSCPRKDSWNKVWGMKSGYKGECPMLKDVTGEGINAGKADAQKFCNKNFADGFPYYHICDGPVRATTSSNGEFAWQCNGDSWCD